MKRALVVLLLGVAACGREPAPAPAAPPKPAVGIDGKKVDDVAERGSLTNIVRGATVISRTAESYLEVSAAKVIDGDPGSFWVMPPRDLPQSVVIGLPARSRVDRVGLRTIKTTYTPKHVQFDASLDGAAWQPLTTAEVAKSDEPQWFDVAPAEASFLRATIIDAPAEQSNVRLYSVLAHGAELEPARTGAIDGCWSFNGRPASFTRRGAHVTGVVAIGAQPLYIDGGVEDRYLRFVWSRGNDYGLALATISADGKHLTAPVWHEEAIPLFEAEPWFGEHAPCGTEKLANDVPLRLLRRVGRYSAFGLRFKADDTLDLEASRDALDYLGKLLPVLRVQARFVVHEFREATPAKNQERSQRRLEAVRAALGAAAAKVGFIAAGSDSPRQEPVTEAMRAIYSSVDLEIRR